jgi:5-methylcytosine-specific restriction endonuclease McrA
MKRTPLRRVSARKAAQLREERKLTARLMIKQNGLCQDCGRNLGWGSAKHEKVFRSHGGDPTDESNTELLCLVCHGARHGEKLVLDN